MKKHLCLLPFFLVCLLANAQPKKPTPELLVAEKWTSGSQKVEFMQENGKTVMKIPLGAGKVVAKDLAFSDGTIEFDTKPNNLSFYFRYKDARENECFYFRMGRAGNPTAIDAVQYTPYIDGVNMWDMYGHYQTNASFFKDDWNHVRLVISGVQMRLYINSPDKPTLEIDRLEGNTGSGTVAFEGDMLISNLTIRPGEVAELSARPGVDPTRQDPRYIRTWAVSEPITTPKNVDFSYDFLPTPETGWQILEAERRGLINLTRTFGKSDPRRLVWLKVKIKSVTAQKKRVDFGFGDDVWVFLNGQIAYVDKNLQGRPIEKKPEGRCSIENTSFILPLKEGHNELLIGLANDFFGWGAIARLEDLEGLEIKPDPTFDYRLIKLSDAIIDAYVGTYVLPNGKNVRITRENKVLKLSGEDFITASLYPQAETTFFMREYPFQVEFVKDPNQKVSRFLINNNGKQVMEVKRAMH
ncbi:hypothetical protein GCM10028803_40870 [Larkinella knui]|uniref:DUF3471 domain-containing protein n=1 Tax=Larkinella knui TaxID=2025310 RepID=A0A3P1CN09_9BACT|nr:DUF3471 domain-containing protein [Larkinella knui]RRB14721.1 DUF3471 domain-containing protein [Larkinella knui]